MWQTVCAPMSGPGIINIMSRQKSVEGEKAIYAPTAEGDSPPPLIIFACACAPLFKHFCAFSVQWIVWLIMDAFDLNDISH